MRVNPYSGCIVNGVRFLTEEEDKHRITQNSAVNSTELHEGEDVDFYGALRSALELSYPSGHRVILFKCKWFDTNPNTEAVRIDCNIASLGSDNTWYDDYPYILADVVQQAFYINLPYPRTHMQKVQYSQFWDALEISENEEDTVKAGPKSCNFTRTSHVNDIEARSLVSASGEAEMINTNLEPNLHDDDVANEGEKFDDLFIYYTSFSNLSCSDSESLSSDGGSDAGSEVDSNRLTPLSSSSIVAVHLVSCYTRK